MAECAWCNGGGWVVRLPGEDKKPCPACHGTGHVPSSDEPTATFDPPIRTRRATVTEVSEVEHDGEPGAWCTIRFRYDVGADLGGRADGYATVGGNDWPGLYWPPAVGDVIRVEEHPTIVHIARPRGESR